MQINRRERPSFWGQRQTQTQCIAPSLSKPGHFESHGWHEHHFLPQCNNDNIGQHLANAGGITYTRD